jgi:hypothetical protein
LKPGSAPVLFAVPAWTVLRAAENAGAGCAAVFFILRTRRGPGRVGKPRPTGPRQAPWARGNRRNAAWNGSILYGLRVLRKRKMSRRGRYRPQQNSGAGTQSSGFACPFIGRRSLVDRTVPAGQLAARHGPCSWSPSRSGGTSAVSLREAVFHSASPFGIGRWAFLL